MAHGPEQQIEHAEHAAHASHDPFNKRVTVSIAIVAAILAGVTMAGHKAHNETLRLQGEALREQTQVGILRTDTANKFAHYQAKKNLSVMYAAFGDLTAIMPLKPGGEKQQEASAEKWKKKLSKYEEEMPGMLKQAEELQKEAEQGVVKAEHSVHASHVAHVRADRFDLGELGLQLGVVLCSLAILTRSRSFWFTGLAVSLVGLLVALTGVLNLFMGEGGH